MLNLTNYQQTDQIYLGTRTLVYKAIREREGKPVIVKVLPNPRLHISRTNWKNE